MYTHQEQLRDLEKDLLDDQNVLAMAEKELEEKYKWVESRKRVVEQDKLRIANLIKCITNK